MTEGKSVRRPDAEVFAADLLDLALTAKEDG